MIAVTPGTQLHAILWDIKVEELNEVDAFYYYERRWRYVDQAKLSDTEKVLVKSLTEKYGNGVML